MIRPFLLGSAVSILLGALAVYFAQTYMFSFPSAFIATVGTILVWGYLPIILLVSPGIMAVVAKVRHTRGGFSYFVGSVVFGGIFTLILVFLVFIGFVISAGP